MLSILRLLFGRTVVRTKNLPLMEGFLIERLKESGFADTERIPKTVRALLLEEALRRAAENEKDGQPRSNEFFEQTKLVASAIVAAFNGDADADLRVKKDADLRVKNILVFHKVL